MFSKTTFCTMPWSSIQINPSGNFKICCFSGNDGNHGIGKDKNGQVMNVMTHSIRDALNSSLHKELRLAQSKNERHPVCRVCWDKEFAHARQIKDNQYQVSAAAQVSHRMARTFKHLADAPGAVSIDDAAKMIADDGSIDNMPVHLDIRFSNLCNSKCVQCEPQYSTLWYGDHMALTGQNTFMVGPATYHIQPKDKTFTSDMPVWHDTNVWWSQFDSIKDRLTDIYVVGGEPFIQPEHDEMLDRLIADGSSKRITLEYDTNLTVINQNILDRLKHFKGVNLSVSLDDVEDRYELIRFPGKWDRLLKNLDRYTADYPVDQVRISMCIGLISVFAPSRIIPFFQARGHQFFPIRLLRSPACYDLAYLPGAIKQQIIDRYKTIDIDPQFKGITLGYLQNNMDRHSEDACLGQMRGFVTRMDALDKLRGTNWKTTMPEMLEMLGNYYGKKIGL